MRTVRDSTRSRGGALASDVSNGSGFLLKSARLAPFSNLHENVSLFRARTRFLSHVGLADTGSGTGAEPNRNRIVALLSVRRFHVLSDNLRVEPKYVYHRLLANGSASEILVCARAGTVTWFPLEFAYLHVEDEAIVIFRKTF
ncbi:hypothetical protein C0J45_16122 [Silurus meridionalis]|nr:hypothetical protein C0J45_16122 [Silurus meridionalis]